VISLEVLSRARKIAAPDQPDRENVLALVENKLKQHSENPQKTG
jgi:hypothetical protein